MRRDAEAKEPSFAISKTGSGDLKEGEEGGEVSERVAEGRESLLAIGERWREQGPEREDGEGLCESLEKQKNVRWLTQTVAPTVPHHVKSKGTKASAIQEVKKHMAVLYDCSMSGSI